MESSKNDDGQEPNLENTEMNEPANQAAPEVAVLEEARKAREDAQKELLYAKAEFENTRKRMIRDQETAIKFANEKFISELLGVTDLLDRALNYSGPLKARENDKEAKDFVSGIEILQKELNQLLARFGVEFIGTPGEKFDPLRHEAISQRESSDENQDTVLEVFQKGSLLNGRLLKPARVVVAVKKA